MKTMLKHHRGSISPSSANSPCDDGQLRRDRWTAAVVVAAMIALLAVIVWLASLGGGPLPDGGDYWPMMP